MAQPNPAGEVWSGERVTRWLRQAPGLERQLAPVSEQLLAAAGVRPGEAVLDVGCGTGPTTRSAAQLAGPSGRVTGLDVSAEMLSAAAAATTVPVEWVHADAASWTAPPASYDVVLSRFGVMFFDDPHAAMSTLATATRPGGRLAVAVWGRRTDSLLFELPYRVAVEARIAAGETVAPLPPDGGPFSWSDDGWVDELLTSSGWAGVGIAVHRLALPFAGGVDAGAAAAAAVDFGPTRTVLTGADEAVVTAAQRGMAEEFEKYVDADGHVVLEATVRIVTALRPSR